MIRSKRAVRYRPGLGARFRFTAAFTAGVALSIQWADSIENAKLREQTITRVGQIYLRQDPAAGRAWLESTNLAPEIKRRISNNPIR